MGLPQVRKLFWPAKEESREGRRSSKKFFFRCFFFWVSFAQVLKESGLAEETEGGWMKGAEKTWLTFEFCRDGVEYE